MPTKPRAPSIEQESADGIHSLGRVETFQPPPTALISSTGTPMRFPYLTTPRVTALVNTSGGGARFLERMPISASSCASQSIAFSTNTTFSGELRAYRSLAKSLVPTTTRRPRGAPFAVSDPARLASSPTSRRCRLSRLKGRDGSRNTIVSCAPPARLVTNSGVTVVDGVWVVSIWLVHGNTTASRSALAGAALVLSARSQKG